jgi:predicted nucleotidyltransferase
MGTPRRRLSDAEFQRLRQAAEQVFGPRSDVLAVYLYGSAARGAAARDLDVAVLFHEPFKPGDLERLAANLQAQGAPHGPEIDLRPLNRAAPRFQVAVLEEGKLLFDRDPVARRRLEAGFMSSWADFRPTWERMRRLMLERWARG